MESTGMILALIGTVVSGGTVIYALWQLLDKLADWMDETMNHDPDQHAHPYEDTRIQAPQP